jgi:translation initiation factor eIF-2B subunit beta
LLHLINFTALLQVVVTAHALLADGGVMAPVGMHMVALAAKRHSVPVVVLVGIYKLSPVFPHEPGVTFNDFKDPADILPYQDESVLAADIAGGWAGLG